MDKDIPETSNLCLRCSSIFLDVRNFQALLEDQQPLRRIEHYRIAELKRQAQLGCALCSQIVKSNWGISRYDGNGDDDDNESSFFTFSPIRRNDWESGFRWATTRSNNYGVPSNYVRFYHFAFPDSRISAKLSNRALNSSVSNDRAMEMIERMFTECSTQHEECPHHEPNLLPSLVIDVNRLRLRETTKDEIGSYAALSYCWGGKQTFQTTLETLSAKLAGFALGNLPQTLQDAIKVTRQLNIKYLWVDSLCIVQDDEKKMAREMANMGLIYNHAQVVIAASRAKSVHEGFLQAAKTNSQNAFTMPVLTSPPFMDRIGIVAIPHEGSGQEPLNTRAWAYQEICLASRALIYTEGGIIWQCNSSFSRLNFEGIENGHHPSEDLVVISKEVRAGPVQRNEWDQIVRKYTVRELTKPDDRLEALAGIAAMIEPLWNSRYFAGLWRQNMESQLGWRLDDGETPFLKKSVKWGKISGPSWSWASVRGPVCEIAKSELSWATGGAKVISCETTLAHPENPFGRVVSGRLTLEAFLVEAKYADRSWFDETSFDCGTGSVESDEIEDLWCLPLGCSPDNTGSPDQWAGLLLEQLPDRTFQRLGHFSQSLDPYIDFEVEPSEFGVEMDDEHSLGPEAIFPVEGSRRVVVIV